MLYLVLGGLFAVWVVAIMVSEARALDNGSYLDVLGEIYEDE